MTTQIGYVPSLVKGLVIMSLADKFGKGQGKINEMQGYVHFARIGIDLFKEEPEKWGRFYRSWYNSPRKNLKIPLSLWNDLSVYSDTDTNFRMSDVFVMSILIGIASKSDLFKEFIEKSLLSNEETSAYRCARNQKSRL